MQHKNHILLTILLLFCMHSFADPGTYYNDVDSTQSCNNFKTILFNKIKNDFHLFYGQIDSFYNKTDLKPAESPLTGFVIIDRYCADIPGAFDSCNFRYNDRTPGVRSFCFTGGTASEYCKCFAKEHSFPSSWFDDSTLMRTDMHFVWPADSKFNNEKSNFPLGYVRPVSVYTSYNGSKVGRSDASRNYGYIGARDTLISNNNLIYNRVFEPIDEFKGDFARAYLYVATRYHDRISNWKNLDIIGGNVISNSSYTGLEPWILQLCVQWHKQDPPNAFERKRNDSVYAIQGNRNPYVDFPGWVEKAFGTNGNAAACISSGIKNNNRTIDFSVFPNPANDFLSIQFARSVSIKSATVEIIDVVGKTIFSQSINQPNEIFSINTANLAKGIYIINIQTEGQNNSLKFVKE
jgi:endonuclease I